MCTTSRRRKVIVSLTVVGVLVGCTIGIRQGYVHMYRHSVLSVTADVLYVAIYLVVPLVVLVVNALLIREMCRASHNAADNLELQHHHHHHQSQQSAVPTVMLVATSLVYVLLRGPLSIMALIHYHLDTGFGFEVCLHVLNAVSRFVFAYNFFVYLITGKQFRSDLRVLFCRRSTSSSSSSAAAAAAAAAVAHDRRDAGLERRGQAATAV